MAWLTDSVVTRVVHTIGVAAVQVLRTDALRSAYRVYSYRENVGYIHHGYDSEVTVANSPDVVYNGMMLEDSGPWQTVHHGEVWLVSQYVGQTVWVEEVTVSQKWFERGLYHPEAPWYG